MSGKKVQIGARPTNTPKAADTWVESRSEGGATEPMKRLTIDVPESLHRAIKTQCAMRGTKIADEVRELLREHFPVGQ